VSQARTVTVERDGDVLRIGVDRVAKRNAWDLQVVREMAQAYEELADSDARVGLVHGHGDHFSAGLDLGEVLPAVQDGGPSVLAGDGRYDPFGLWGDPVPKPVVLAVQGVAFTLSIELALASDVVVAADDVRFRQLEIGRGILPFGGATVRAPQQLGWGNAMRWILTAEEFGAQEAHRIGLVQEVVPAGQQLERAAEIAHLIAAQAPLGVRGTLANARAALRADQDRATEHLQQVLPTLIASQDAREGLQSFLERRPAHFLGR
jgi:enoyl-CoA hydratase/carnithine racemase